jgi:uncharacterized protein (TIGR03067 family)
MKKLIAAILMVIAAAVVFVMSSRRGDPLDGLGGTAWELVGMDRNGKLSEKVPRLNVVFGKGKVVWIVPTREGEKSLEGVCRFEPGSRPKRFEMTVPIRFQDGRIVLHPGKETTEGIYQLQEQDLVLVLTISDPEAGVISWVFQKLAVPA